MGDISDQLALKKNMNCKSFDWFMKEVAYDILEKYPPLPPNQFWGDLINVGTNGEYCLDTNGRHPPEKVSKRRIYLSRDMILIASEHMIKLYFYLNFRFQHLTVTIKEEIKCSASTPKVS